ncbi:MAG: hypothetical protein AB1589_21645 [Cyanobacteriota bacterium]
MGEVDKKGAITFLVAPSVSFTLNRLTRIIPKTENEQMITNFSVTSKQIAEKFGWFVEVSQVRQPPNFDGRSMRYPLGYQLTFF